MQFSWANSSWVWTFYGRDFFFPSKAVASGIHLESVKGVISICLFNTLDLFIFRCSFLYFRQLSDNVMTRVTKWIHWVSPCWVYTVDSPSVCWENAVMGFSPFVWIALRQQAVQISWPASFQRASVVPLGNQPRWNPRPLTPDVMPPLMIYYMKGNPVWWTLSVLLFNSGLVVQWLGMSRYRVTGTSASSHSPKTSRMRLR